jgi:hypothetical protein
MFMAKERVTLVDVLVLMYIYMTVFIRNATKFAQLLPKGSKIKHVFNAFLGPLKMHVRAKDICLYQDCKLRGFSPLKRQIRGFF